MEISRRHLALYKYSQYDTVNY